MELSSFIFQEENFRAQKVKKNYSEKISYFRKWKFLLSRLKKFLYFLKKGLYFWRELAKPERQKFIIFQGKNICEVSTAVRKNSYETSTAVRENPCEANKAASYQEN